MAPVVLHDILFAHGDAAAARTAIVDGDTAYSYADLAQAVERLAAAIAASGVTRRDRGGILLPKFVSEFAAVLAAGAAR